MTVNWDVSIGDILTGLGMMCGMGAFFVGVVRNINGKFTTVAVTMARIDERVKNVEGDVVRLDGILNTTNRR